MSVYLDHFYIRPTKKSYDSLKDTFEKLIGAELFQYGEFESEGNKYAGFYVHFENGSFLEVLDPEISTASQAVGLCMTCEKEYRGHFLEQIKSVLTGSGKEVEFKKFPEEDPTLTICRPTAKNYISAWGVEYSDQWMKDWGSQVSKLGLLSPFESFFSASFTYPKIALAELQDNLSWIDDRMIGGPAISLPLKDGNATNVSFNEGDSAQCKMSFIVGVDCDPVDISGEDFSFTIDKGMATLETSLHL